ncbi:MAG: hypothetical protein M0R17_09075 [Candidatus Omnitrophica bacterium]|jgi:hypothetical protein|nr:hypothetical protein [Candidatus Omnitrophota bacterium]
MWELFKEQLEGNQIITGVILEQLVGNKTYFNGEKIQIGEKFLSAMLIGDLIEKEDGHIPIVELPMKLIKLNERHFDLFEHNEHEQCGKGYLPVIRLKKVVD